MANLDNWMEFFHCRKCLSCIWKSWKTENQYFDAQKENCLPLQKIQKARCLKKLSTLMKTAIQALKSLNQRKRCPPQLAWSASFFSFTKTTGQHILAHGGGQAKRSRQRTHSKRTWYSKLSRTTLCCFACDMYAYSRPIAQTNPTTSCQIWCKKGFKPVTHFVWHCCFNCTEV